jgi:carbamoylphosphate synthase small subunit
VQNHCQVIDADSLGKVRNVKISAYNLNDRSVEEFESRKLKFLGVQYIPACPGFDEINRVFTRFLKISKKE